MGSLVLGVNSVYHESSACLLDGARVLAFCEEERLTRVKRAKRLTLDNADELPERAIDWCLAASGASWADVGRVAYSYDPDARPAAAPDPAEDVRPGSWGSAAGEALFQRTVRGVPGVLSRLAGTSSASAATSPTTPASPGCAGTWARITASTSSTRCGRRRRTSTPP